VILESSFKARETVVGEMFKCLAMSFIVMLIVGFAALSPTLCKRWHNNAPIRELRAESSLAINGEDGRANVSTIYDQLPFVKDFNVSIFSSQHHGSASPTSRCLPQCPGKPGQHALA
jgi:hypothetical protein